MFVILSPKCGRGSSTDPYCVCDVGHPVQLSGYTAVVSGVSAAGQQYAARWTPPLSASISHTMGGCQAVWQDQSLDGSGVTLGVSLSSQKMSDMPISGLDFKIFRIK